MITYETAKQIIIHQDQPVLVNGITAKVSFILNTPGGLLDHDAVKNEPYSISMTWSCDFPILKDAGTW